MLYYTMLLLSFVAQQTHLTRRQL